VTEHRGDHSVSQYKSDVSSLSLRGDKSRPDTSVSNGNRYRGQVYNSLGGNTNTRVISSDQKNFDNFRRQVSPGSGKYKDGYKLQSKSQYQNKYNNNLHCHPLSHIPGASKNTSTVSNTSELSGNKYIVY